MTKSVEDIIEDVRVALDQNNSSTALLAEGDIDTLSLNEIIKSKIVEAVRSVHATAPYYMLEQGHNIPVSICWLDDVTTTINGVSTTTVGTDTAGFVLLPKDFQRLVVFQLSDWERPVYNAISTDDTEYEKQFSRFKGLRGTSQKPVCAIAVRSEGLALEFFSCKSRNVTVTRAVYIPLASIDDSGNVDLSERCYPAIVYMVAALTLYALSDTERGKVFEELSKSQLQE
jgi:hypothetical protein